MYIRDGEGFCSEACADRHARDWKPAPMPPCGTLTPSEGVEDMAIVQPKDVRNQASRWLEEGQELVGALLELLSDYERLRDRAESSERENARLHAVASENEQLRHRVVMAEGECGRLRDALTRLEAERERTTREREELAEHLTRVMNEILGRLRACRT